MAWKLQGEMLEACSCNMMCPCCQRPSKAAQVWPSKIAHLAEVTSL